MLSWCAMCRLDHIQERVESVLPVSPSNFEQIATWQKVLHTQSSKKVQEYLDNNLEQIAKVWAGVQFNEYLKGQSSEIFIPFFDIYG